MNPYVKKTLTVCGSLALLLYVIIACAWSHSGAGRVNCAGLENDRVVVIDPSGSGFVQPDSITAELYPLFGDLTNTAVKNVNLAGIKDYLLQMDKIEDATVVMLNNNRLRVQVSPIVPVARVWTGSGRSYYVNRQGKQVPVTRRFKADVPYIQGNLSTDYSPESLMPLLEYLASHSDMNKLVTMISVADSNNIILVPAIRGHVINLGNASNINNKFHRLRRFYSTVMPVKGWEYYDTISVKWNNQVVATRRKNKLPKLNLVVVDDSEFENFDLETISTTSHN